MNVALWEFPAADFDAWRALVCSPEVASYADYMSLLAAVQADLERSGKTVRRVKMTVAQMQAGLLERGLENTPDNRAAVTAMRA